MSDERTPDEETQEDRDRLEEARRRTAEEGPVRPTGPADVAAEEGPSGEDYAERDRTEEGRA